MNSDKVNEEEKVYFNNDENQRGDNNNTGSSNYIPNLNTYGNAKTSLNTLSTSPMSFLRNSLKEANEENDINRLIKGKIRLQKKKIRKE